MKCDELKTVCYIDAYSTMPVYCAKEVDEAFDELKARITDNSALIETLSNELEKLRPMETALEIAEADNKKYIARIKELEAENERLTIDMRNAELRADVADAAIAELKAKLESVQASMYCDVVDANMEIRRLKRALWIAHAYKAKFKRWWLHLALDYEASMIRPNTKTINRIRGKIGNCEKSERKCRAKAEEYK